MTDKQIIDKCEFFWKEKGCCNNGNLSSVCEENEDCLYRKYLRKEQECERLEKHHYELEEKFLELNTKSYGYILENDQLKDELEDYITETEEDKKIIVELKAENKKLKEEKENYCFDCDVAERMRKVTYAATGGRLSYANYTVEAIEEAYNDQLRIDVEYRTKELEEQLDQLKAENDELKKCSQFEFDETLLQYSNTLDELKAENEELKNFHINLVGVKECEIKELLKLKQTLTEIKEIAEDTIDLFDEGLETGTTYDRVVQILQKCEVDNENTAH